MDLSSYLLKALALGFTAGIMPGAFQAYLINQAALHGWRRAALASLGPLLSDGPIIILAVLVLGVIPGWALLAVQIIGGLFIAYLAVRALRSLLNVRRQGAEAPAPTSLLAAALINFTNPTVYIYWATVSGPLFIEGWHIAPLWGISYLACFYGIMVLTSNGLILVVSGLRTLGTRIQRILQLISVGLLFVMAAIQVISGLRGLV